MEKRLYRIAVMDRSRGTVDIIEDVPAATACSSGKTRRLLYNMGYMLDSCEHTILKGKNRLYRCVRNGKDARLRN